MMIAIRSLLMDYKVGEKEAHVFRLASPVLCVDILEGRAPTKYRHCLQAMALC
jgi:hypothetical protein